MDRMNSESVPKKAKTISSAGKVMAAVFFFFGFQGVILIEYLEKGKTIAGNYHATLLDQLKEELKQKRPRLVCKNVLFHQDFSSSIKSSMAVATFAWIRLQIIPHSPYSPDLTPCDFSCSQTWKFGSVGSNSTKLHENFFSELSLPTFLTKVTSLLDLGLLFPFCKCKLHYSVYHHTYTTTMILQNSLSLQQIPMERTFSVMKNSVMACYLNCLTDHHSIYAVM